MSHTQPKHNIPWEQMRSGESTEAFLARLEKEERERAKQQSPSPTPDGAVPAAEPQRKPARSGTITLGQLIARKNQDMALFWARELGKRVFPTVPNDKPPLTPNGFKNATTDDKQILTWWSDRPDAGVGVPAGDNGLAFVDVEEEKGWGSLRRLQEDHEPLPETVEVLTGGGGGHFYFTAPSGFKPVSLSTMEALGYPGIEIRAGGQYVVTPPSGHPGGRAYMWAPDHEPWEMPIVPMPEWLVTLTQECAVRRQARNRDGERIPKGIRDDMLTSLAGTMRMRKMTEEEILQALYAVNENRCAPPLERHQVEKIARSVGQYSPGFELTELGNARRLVHRHGNDLRFVKQFGKWLIWDGIRWKKDESGEIFVLAKGTVETIVAEAASDSEARVEKLKWHKRSQSEHVIRAMVKLAETEPDVMARPEDFDQDRWMLGVQNGTLDLRSGKLHEHTREDHLTMLALVVYDPNATAPKWKSFLERVLPDPDVRAFIQRSIGYALTGDTREEVMLILHGSGQNGKSTLIGTVSHMLGPDYSVNTPTSTFLIKRQEGISNDVARLDGARLVTTIEAEGDRRLAEALVKSVTGRDRITARHLYQEFFEYEPQFKLFLVVNYKPVIRGTDHAIWRRILLVPFDVTIPDAEKDGTLKDALKESEELSGILNWALEGCLEWQRSGLRPPETVRVATEGYRDEMDRAATVRVFLEERCEPWHGTTPTRDLYAAYKQWCGTETQPVHDSVFGRALGEAGYRSVALGRMKIGGRQGVRLSTAGLSTREKASNGR